MRILVVSDIHSNLAALDAVLAAAGDFDGLWCLGDLVGYGPEPDECVERLRSLDPVCLAGNHDLAAVGALSLDEFNPEAREAAIWTRSRLSEPHSRWLAGLPAMLALPEFEMTLVHGSPIDPIWDYIFDAAGAELAFASMATRHGLSGHTHIPLIFRAPASRSGVATQRPRLGLAVRLGKDRLLFNPGSVGQPRDLDPRASFALFDAEANTLTHRRARYDIRATQDKMRSAGLPERLIRRLEFGE